MDKDNPFENNDNYKDAPLFIKATEILQLSHRIAEIASQYEDATTPEKDLQILRNYALLIREDASKIPTKISGAWNVDLYDIRMEMATIIRKSARDLATHMTGLEIYGFKESEYLDLLRNEIEAFRILFAEWVSTFDPWNYTIDRWGLFNPPGIRYDDPDPDDDFPIDPDDFNFED